jgi:hypothetical protein
MIGLCLPSRGLMHSRMVQSLLESLNGLEFDAYWSHDRPIPECFNVPIQEAIDDGCDPIIIWEDDVVATRYALKTLLGAVRLSDIAFYDTKLDNGPTTLVMNGITVSGTSLIAFRRDIIQSLMPLRITQRYDGHTLEPLPEWDHDKAMQHWGGQDYDLFIRAQAAGYTVKHLGTLPHCRLRQLGNRHVNNGVDTIEII